MKLFWKVSYHARSEGLHKAQCAKCGSTDVFVEIFIKGNRFLGIPVVSEGKYSVVVCKGCGHAIREENMEPNLWARAEVVKSRVNVSIKESVGLIGFCILVIFGVYLSTIAAKRIDEQHILEPMVGDLYTIKTEERWYSLAEVQTIANDTVWVFISNHMIDQPSKATDELKDDLIPIAFPYSFDELEKMLKNEKIVSVDRPITTDRIKGWFE